MLSNQRQTFLVKEATGKRCDVHILHMWSKATIRKIFSQSINPLLSARFPTRSREAFSTALLILLWERIGSEGEHRFSRNSEQYFAYVVFSHKANSQLAAEKLCFLQYHFPSISRKSNISSGND